MNELIAPQGLNVKRLFSNSFSVKNASISSFWAAPLIGELLIACMFFLYIFVFQINWIRSLVIIMPAALFFYLIRIFAVYDYRKKIIADMESAKPISKVYDLRGIVSGNGEHTTYVSTMAGELKFVGDRLFAFKIVKKSGKFFDYYDFPKTEGLNKKDLRQFIAPKGRFN